MLRSALLALGAAVIVAAPAAAQDRSNWPSSFSVGTASQGGTYFVYGAGWANLVSEAIGVPGSAEATGGPVQNAALVQTGDMDMGMVTMGPARDAVDGQSELAPGLVHDKIRAIFPMYTTAFHVIAPASKGWTKITDIPDGSTIGVGPQGGTPGTYWPRFFETLGMDVKVQYGGASDLAGQMQDGLIDAFAFAAGMPFPAFSELDAQMDVSLLAFTPEEVEKITADHPVSAFTIEGGLYPSMPDDQNSVAMWNFAIANADLPDDFVYAVVDTVMSNPDRMKQIHSAAVETIPENFDKNTFLLWHPGAVRWFEEKGFDIPADLGG